MFEVVFEGDEGIYIVKRGDFYYTVDIAEDVMPFRSKYVETFLKFGGFSYVDRTIDNDVTRKIKAVLKKYDRNLDKE